MRFRNDSIRTDKPEFSLLACFIVGVDSPIAGTVVFSFSVELVDSELGFLLDVFCYVKCNKIHQAFIEINFNENAIKTIFFRLFLICKRTTRESDNKNTKNE